MNFGLSDTTIGKLCQIFSKYPEIEQVIIYGSRAKGNYREGSDIDLTLMGEIVTEQIRSHVWIDQDGLNTPYLVDLSVFNHIRSDSLINHIKRVGKSFYKRSTHDVAI